MRNKKVVIVAFIIAMIALVQIQISPVLGYQKEETPLYPISGSDVDNRALGGADGFAVAMTMDLPVAKMESTHARVAFAVGLADPWGFYDYPKYWTFTPFVKEMWVKVEGDGDYEPSPGEIVDNTGTGGPSTPDFWIALELVGALFTAYDIANLLFEVYQEPPSQEWEPELHSVKAIVRQTGQPQYDPRLQTASIWLDNYFKRDGWNTLTITAEAESWVRAEVYDVETGFRWSWYEHSGTYQVAYEVKVAADEPPETPSKPSGTTSGYVGSSYTYSSVAIDPDEDNIRYQFDWGDGSNTTTIWYTSGTTASASHTWGSLGEYYVKVRAQDVYEEWSNWSPILAVTISNRAPSTPSTPAGPTSGYRGISYNYETSTTDPDGDDVRYKFSWGDGTTTMTGWYDSGETATESHIWTSAGTKYVRVRAVDSVGLWSDWSPSLEVTIVNRVPNIPSTPTGPTSGYRDISYSYNTSTTDPDGDDVRYKFSWGDGTTTMTGWYDSGETATESHTWTSTGTKYVTVRAQDSAGSWSDYSPVLAVTIVNRVPNVPSTPTGPTLGYYGHSYTYNTSTTDPDGDDVCYEFDWGGGSTTTTGWYPSGSIASASCLFYSTGIYDVTVRAKDEYGAWSDWSYILTVNITDGGPGGGGGGEEFDEICPRLFVWNGSDYAEEFIFDLHGDSDVTMCRTIGQLLVPENDHYLLSLRELGETISHIDYVKLYAVDAEGVMHECHLAVAVHSELGNVKQLLLCDDDERIDLGSSQTIDFKFNMPDVENIDYFIFEIQGYEPN